MPLGRGQHRQGRAGGQLRQRQHRGVAHSGGWPGGACQRRDPAQGVECRYATPGRPARALHPDRSRQPFRARVRPRTGRGAGLSLRCRERIARPQRPALGLGQARSGSASSGLSSQRALRLCDQRNPVYHDRVRLRRGTGRAEGITDHFHASGGRRAEGELQHRGGGSASERTLSVRFKPRAQQYRGLCHRPEDRPACPGGASIHPRPNPPQFRHRPLRHVAPGRQPGFQYGRRVPH